MSTGSFDGVSVVIPVLNEAPYLNEAVSRVLEQKVDVDLEVILALGPSIDNTNEVAAKLAQRDSRVKLVQSKTGKTAAGPTPKVLRIAHATAFSKFVIPVAAITPPTTSAWSRHQAA